MADSSWEHAAEARAALRAIVNDPDHGVPALSNPRTVSNLLKDLLPDAPREKNLLVAAAEAGLADTLREHVDQGLDPGTAIRLTASSFSERSPIGQDACTWVTSEIAMAMGISLAASASASAGAGSGAGAGNLAETESAGASNGGAWASPAASPNGGAPANPVTAPNGGAWADLGTAANGGGWYGAGRPAGPPAGPFASQAYQPGYQPIPMPAYQPVPGRSQSSNSLAVVAFVLGVAQVIGWFIFLVPGLLAAILAIVLGFASIKQTNRTGERGRGLATTGIVLGFTGIAIVGLLILIGVAAMNSGNYSNN